MENHKTEQVNSDEFPVYTKNVLPDNAQLLMLVEEPDYDGAGKLTAAYRLPLDRVAAGGGLNTSAYSLYAPNADDVTPGPRSVFPGYIEQFDPHNVKLAQGNSGTTRAQFMIIGPDPLRDGNILVQGDGFYTFAQDHNFNPGSRYYLAATSPGGYETTPTSGAQLLFTVIDHRTIHINIGA